MDELEAEILAAKIVAIVNGMKGLGSNEADILHTKIRTLLLGER